MREIRESSLSAPGQSATTGNQPESRLREPWRRLFDPIEIAPLVYFRIVFGAIMLWECWRYYDKGWIERYWIDKPFHFAYFGFGWAQHPWPGDGMYWHFAAMAVLAVCIMLGYRYRLSATLFFLAFTYMFLLEQTTYLNHFYMVCLVSFLMIFVPAHRAFSRDALRGPEIRSETAPAWTLWMLRAQLGIVYFFGGLAKINSDWLRGEPMRMWLAKRTDFPLIGSLFTEEWMVYSLSYGGMLLDLFVVPCLLWRPTRFYALGLITLFHLMNAKLFSIGIFPWFMIAATLIFLPPSWFRIRVSWPAYEQYRRRRPHLPASRPLATRKLFGMLRPAAKAWLPATPKIIVACLGVYFGIQLFMPLRHWLYPGTVHWTEEGHNFSWHMKLRTKLATIRFDVTDPETNRTWRARRKYLTRRQIRKMSTRPDMILQFAHFLADEARKSGVKQPEVRVRCRARLNGRKAQDLIDPNVNLAAETSSLWPAPWIVPLTEPFRSSREG